MHQYDKSSIGAIKEVFHNNRSDMQFCGPSCGNRGYLYEMICIKETYPTRLIKSTTYQAGMSNISETLQYDTLTGLSLKDRNTNPYGNVVETEIVPAYFLEEYNNLGLKSVNNSYSNQAFLVAEQKSTQYNHFITPGEFISNEINTYGDKYFKINYDGTYFQHQLDTLPFLIDKKQYHWKGALGLHGNYDTTYYVPFSHHPDSINNENWEYGSEISLYDDELHILESKSINNDYAATKFGYNNRYPVVSGTNTNYNSFTFTGFEDTIRYGNDLYFDGHLNEINFRSDVHAHTGYFAAKVSTNTIGPKYLVQVLEDSINGDLFDRGIQTGRLYQASVWIHKDSDDSAALAVSVNGEVGGVSYSRSYKKTKNSEDRIKSGNWYLISIAFEIPETYTTPTTNDRVEISLTNETGSTSNSYFDDFMFKPINANVSAQVYDKRTGRILASINNKNFATKTTFDASGNQIKTEVEIPNVGFKIASEQIRNYSRAIK